MLVPQTIHAQDDHEGTLAGTWFVTVNIPNPPPGIPATFQALHSYMSDGRFIDQSNRTSGSVGDAHGEWEPLGSRRFALTFLFFGFDPAGNHVLTVKVRSTLTLNEQGNQWTGPFVAQAYSPTGTPLGPPINGMHSGVRIVNEPLQ